MHTNGAMEWAIRTFGLSKRSAAGTPALRGVSLAVAPGEVCALTGPAGSGKSTLLAVLATAVRADAGSFCLAGHRVTSYPGDRQPLAAVRRLVGYLPAEPGHFQELTGAESLWLYARAYGLSAAEARLRIDVLLAWAQLEPVARQRVATYPYPARRRLALAQALLHRPPVLLLDDPGRGQPPGFRQALAQFLEQQAGAGTAVLLAAGSTGGPELAACRRQLHLQGGCLV